MKKNIATILLVTVAFVGGLALAADLPQDTKTVPSPLQYRADDVLVAGETLAQVEGTATMGNSVLENVLLSQVGTRTVPVGKEARVRVSIKITIQDPTP